MSDMRVVVNASSLGDTLFRPHGEYVARVDGCLIRSEVSGPFNQQWALAYRDRVQAMYAEAARQGPFAVLTRFSESMMVNRDAVDTFAQAVAGFQQQFADTWKGVAFVAARDIEGRSVMDYLFAQRIYGPIGVPYRLFEDAVVAEAWLRNELLA